MTGCCRRAKWTGNWARERLEDTGEKQRLFTAFDYAAGSWRRPRRVIAKAGHPAKGSNPRFIVSNIVGDSQQLYDRRYCARGEMENRIKEQMMLFADRVSAHRRWANPRRLLLPGLACTLMQGLRRLALPDPGTLPQRLHAICGLRTATGF